MLTCRVPFGPRLLAPLLAAAWAFSSPAVSQCPPPGAPVIDLFSSLPAAAGQSYVVAWKAAPGLDAEGTYEVERSTTPDFAAVTAFGTSATGVTLTSSDLGTLYHRVRGIQSCGTAGPRSNTVPVTIVEGSPVVIFSVVPPGVVRTSGSPLTPSTFEVRNIGGQRFLGYFGKFGSDFFEVSESGIVDLGPGERKTFTLEYTEPVLGTNQAVLTIQSAAGAQPKAYPWAYVNLVLAPRTAERSSALLDGTLGAPVFSTDFVSFQATAADRDPPPVSVSVHNPRSVPMALAAETAPDGWVVPQALWNNTPLAPGETRQLTVESRRLQGETGGVLPRYAFLTVRTEDGQSARLQLQDLDSSSGGPCAARPALGAGEPALLVPSVVTSDRQVGERRIVFISRLLLSNIGVDAAVADLYFTPDRGEPATDGFDCARVLKASVAVPGSDVLSLTDPLSKLFGFAPADQVSGTLEIRSSRVGQLRADSVVDSPDGKGGLFGFQLPVVSRGTGAVKGTNHFIAGLTSDATYRSNVILAETRGKEAVARVTVTDDTGAVIFTADRSVPPYAKVQAGLNDGDLFRGRTVPSATVELSVTEGDGSVVGLATVIDRVNQDASTFLGRALPAASGTRRRGPLADFPYRYLVPTVVNGFNSKPGRGPFPYESVVTIANGTGQPVTARMTYVQDDGTVREGEPFTIAGRQTRTWTNVLREVFGITNSSTGALALDLDRQSVVITSRVFSRTDEGSFGDAVPVYPIATTAATTGADQKRLLADGFEHSVDDLRGARTNLILTEIDGKPAEVEVRLFEKGKERSGPIGVRRLSLGAFRKMQLNRVFDELGTGGKDRSNVLCEVVALPGSQGRVVALGTRVDNVTADAKILAMTPLGETPGSPSIGF